MGNIQKIVIKACHHKKEEKLRAMATVKCERIKQEEFENKPYIKKKNIFYVRQQYKSRFKMQVFTELFFLLTEGLGNIIRCCLCKEAREDKAHLTSGKCKVYRDLCNMYRNMTNNDSPLQFFTEVLSRSDQLEVM